jgi:hypothetical protein
MAAVVVVQGLPPAPAFRAAVLSACSEALEFRSCVSAEETGPSASTSAVAAIAWPEGNDRHARDTLYRFDAAADPRIERDTRFAEHDPLVERWRTIGLVIAALVGESETPREGAEASVHRSSVARDVGAGPRGWLGLSGLVGPGLDDGTLRIGADVHGAVHLSPLFFLHGSASHAVRPTDQRHLDVRWTTLAAGGGARTHITPLDLAVGARIEVMLEIVHADSTSGAALGGGGNRVSPGIRFGADALWPANTPIGLTLGLSAWSLPGGTSIRIDGQKLASSQWFGYAGLLGAQWSFR